MSANPINRRLAVFMHLDSQFVPAGLLGMTEAGTDVLASEFKYGLLYLDRGNAIEVDPVSLPIQDKGAIRGKALLPTEGLTLFGGIRDAAPDAWGRRVIEARLRAPMNSLPESTYLLQAGGQRVGALDIRPSLDSPPIEIRSSVHRLEYLMEAADRIEQGQAIPSQLEDIFDAGSNLGGMRPKATVEDDDGTLWLAKFPSQGERMDVPCIEAATMRLAAEAGLDVPAVKTETLHGKTVMMIRRFDREWIDGKQHRRHMVSALTMLACDERASREKSYGEIADAIRARNAGPLIKNDNRELFARMVFNILVTNDDDHLRNHAFLWNHRVKGWGLSPLYDVMPRPTMATERFLHLGVGEQGRLATLDNALSGYSRFGITLHDARETIDRVWRVVREWKTYFEGYGVPGGEIEKIAPAFRHLNDVLRS
ncbi:MAG: HipA domain-containing protein [Burkholderiales bacterium]|nr:HipA domain-containing protein [Burkholderiales bacterium]